jgi:5-(carboxyamino)imidazole ribonucleotide mutase
MRKVAIVMGSKSDFESVLPAKKTLDNLGIATDVMIMSAHRTPKEVEEFSVNAETDGYGVIIAAAGKAAHLAGVIAANTVLPVIGIPMKSSTLDGLDSLLSTVQMPSGIPVATVAISGSENAALLAAEILAVGSPELTDKLKKLRIQMKEKILSDNEAIQNLI